MQVFNYVAKDEVGESVKGKVEARDQKHAADILRGKHLVIISLKAVNQSSLSSINSSLMRISSQDRVMFTQQLATMINAGMPLTDALNLLQMQNKPAMAAVIEKVLRDIEGGSSLGESLKKHKNVFSPVYISLVQAGEAAGKLDDVLERLAENEEKKHEFINRVRGALIYPVIVLLAMIVVMLVMMLFVVPKLTQMYDELGAELPIVTQMVIGLSDFMLRFWWLLLILILGGVYGFKSWRKTPKGRYKSDEILLKTPLVGPLTAQLTLTEFTRTLSLLLHSGISILDSLQIVKMSTSNMVYRSAMDKAAVGVEKGMPLAAMLARQQIFPPLMPQMMAVGEETGRLDEVLYKVSVFFEKEADNKVKNLTTAIEPLIMILMGVGVGFLVFAIIMPIYNLTSLF